MTYFVVEMTLGYIWNGEWFYESFYPIPDKGNSYLVAVYGQSTVVGFMRNFPLNDKPYVVSVKVI